MEKNQVLDQLNKKEISKKQAYKLLYEEPKQRKPKKAHFVKLRVTVPEEKGANIFLAIILLLPIPIFLVKLFIKRRQTVKILDTDISIKELIEMISIKGVSLNVKTHDGNRVFIKTY
jgi:hypothetical protein